MSTQKREIAYIPLDTHIVCETRSLNTNVAISRNDTSVHCEHRDVTFVIAAWMGNSDSEVLELLIHNFSTFSVMVSGKTISLNIIYKTFLPIVLVRLLSVLSRYTETNSIKSVRKNTLTYNIFIQASLALNDSE